MTETEESYYNAYQLLIGATDYDKLAEQEVFYLPGNHEDPDVVLRHFESVEDYEKCNRIINCRKVRNNTLLHKSRYANHDINLKSAIKHTK